MTPGLSFNVNSAAYRGPHLIRMLQQPGRGKWDAVRTGLAAAQGDVLVIQDADLTAPPEDLSKFFDALLRPADLLTEAVSSIRWRKGRCGS